MFRDLHFSTIDTHELTRDQNGYYVTPTWISRGLFSEDRDELAQMVNSVQGEIVAGMRDRSTTSSDGSRTQITRVVLRMYPLTNYPAWNGSHTGNWNPRWHSHVRYECHHGVRDHCSCWRDDENGEPLNPDGSSMRRSYNIL